MPTLIYVIHIKYVYAHLFSRVWLFAISWTVAHQAYSFPWNFPGRNIRAGCHFLLQEIFLTQGLDQSLLHWQADSLPLHHLGSLSIDTSIITYTYTRHRHWDEVFSSSLQWIELNFFPSLKHSLKYIPLVLSCRMSKYIARSSPQVFHCPTVGKEPNANLSEAEIISHVNYWLTLLSFYCLLDFNKYCPTVRSDWP